MAIVMIMSLVEELEPNLLCPLYQSQHDYVIYLIKL